MDYKISENVIGAGLQYNTSSTICNPIDSVSELYDSLAHPPAWTKHTVGLTRRCNYVIKNTQEDCHIKEIDFKPKQRIPRSTAPKTLICHDMMGGYLEDKFIGGVNKGNGFTFHRWAHTDIFCYFSHHFVTVPTLPWINLAHSQGNAVIGTIITEHTNGIRICMEVFEDEKSYTMFADALVEICVIYTFDGWLINIENPVQKPGMLLKFIRYLTDKMHQRIPWSYVIWYDSVLEDGRLQWQNELNERNKCYFDACDGIFLNYGWSESEMLKTKEMAKDRALDVYVGIDIWGRGSYGGGKFNAYKAAKVIEDFQMSMAIFAHGWVHETTPKKPEHDFLKRYYSRSSLLWKLLWPHMYTTPIEHCFRTFFKTGVTSNYYNLKLQDVQPSYFPAHAITTETKNVDVAYDICKCVQERVVFDKRLLLISNKNIIDADIVHRLFSTNIKLTGKTTIHVFTYAYEDCITDYELILLVADGTNKILKVVGTSERLAPTNNDIWRISPETIFKDEEYPSVPNHWDHRGFTLNFHNHELLEVGIKLVGDNYLYLCGFSIAMD